MFRRFLKHPEAQVVLYGTRISYIMGELEDKNLYIIIAGRYLTHYIGSSWLHNFQEVLVQRLFSVEVIGDRR